ncbi:hypothetical protein J6590_088465 [Homalodisca vitripennis]|nr:hypothetical protein J6590_088465 [Homalodisca vitripennis]
MEMQDKKTGVNEEEEHGPSGGIYPRVSLDADRSSFRRISPCLEEVQTISESRGLDNSELVEDYGILMGKLNWVDGAILVEDNFVEDVVHEIEPVEFDPDEIFWEETPDDPRDKDYRFYNLM